MTVLVCVLLAAGIGSLAIFAAIELRRSRRIVTAVEKNFLQARRNER